MNPAITVIIPSYNAEKTLKRCLDSIFVQDFDSLEVIMVNDGSKDGTLNIAKEYDMYPNFVLIDQPNAGVAAARWTGITASRGEYLAFVDADDYIAPDMISKMYAKAKSTGAEIIVCDYYSVAKNKIYFSHKYKETLDESGIKAVQRIIFNNGDNCIWNKLIKKDLIREDVYKKSIGMTFGEDKLFITQTLCFANKVGYVDEALYYYDIQNAGSVTNNPSVRCLIDLIKAESLLLDFFSHSEIIILKQAAKWSYLSGLIDALRVIARIENCPEVKEIRKSVEQKLSIVPLYDIIRAQKFRIVLDILLLKTGLFAFIYSIWEKPYLNTLRMMIRKR